MISYDRYENKIKKFAKFRNVIKRFKFLFLAIFALMIAAVATLLGLKGSFSGEIKISDSVYGESYSDPEGVSAFLSSVSYEYAKAGSEEWNSQKPYKAGKYSVRAVSDKTVGKGYGKTASFEIAPREVEFLIESDSVEYGGVPNKISLDLLAGDSLDKSALLFEYDDYVSERTGVDLIESSVKIMNGTDDRSACYTVRHEKKELDITKRSIGVSLKTENFVYSGSAVSYTKSASESTVLRLANGDEIRIGSALLKQNGVEIAGAVFAGSYEAAVGDFRIVKVIGGTEIDVTSQYSANMSDVSFAIGKRPVTVQTASAEKEYDGLPLVKADGFVATGLVSGDEFTVLKSSSLTNAKANADNAVSSYEIKNAEGTDLRDNYEIKWEYGKLTVKPRKITVTSPSTETPWVYDGTAKSLCAVSFRDELFEAVARTTPKTSPTTVGKYFNEVNFDLRNLKTGETESKENFEITTKWGVLEIVKRDITVTIDSVEKIYDGRALVLSFAAGNCSDKVRVTSGSLGAGDFLADGELHEITDVYLENGTVKGVDNRSTYKIYSSNGERTDCYNIKYVKGQLKVTPRHISITTNSREFVYDGNPHSDGGYRCFIVYENWESETVKVPEGSIALKGNAPAFVNVSDTKGVSKNNVCSYDISSNFVLDSIIYGTITILPRSLTVTTNSNTFVYDGNSHSDGGYRTAHGAEAGLIGSDQLNTLSVHSVVNVLDTEEENNVCKYSVPNDNYTIENYIYGTLTVTARTLTVVTGSDGKVYDGEPLSKNEYTKTYYINKEGAEEAGLLGGDKLTLLNSFSILNVWETAERNNACTFSEPNANYKIIRYDCGTLTVTPREICVITGSAQKVYDGEPLSNDDEPEDTYYVDKDGERQAGLLNGDQLIPKQRYSITNVWETEEQNNVCTFSEPNGNYKITGYDCGMLKVTPRHITLLTSSQEFIYDGNPHSDDGCTVYEQGTAVDLIKGNTLTLKGSAPSFTNVADTKNAVGNNVCQYTVTDNYEIDDTLYGTITILPRSLTVTTNSNTFVYDGKPHSDGGYRTAHGAEAGLIGSDKLNTLSVHSVVNVLDTKEENNVCKYSVPNDNYTIENYIYGTLTVTKRMIWVVTASDEKDFDGTPLSKNEYTDTYYLNPEGGKEAGLIGADRLTLLFSFSILNVWETAEHNNACAFSVPNDNYAIKGYDYGTLTIKPREIRVLTGSDEKVFDGQPLSKDDEPEDTYYIDKAGDLHKGLVNGDTLIPKKRFSITNVRETAEHNNVCTFSEPNENYRILDYAYGTLTVTPKPVEIRIFDVTVSYGEEFFYPAGMGNFANADTCGFVGEDTAIIEVRFELSQFGYKEGDRVPVRWVDDGNGGYEIGGYENAIVKGGITISVGGDLKNYDISYTDGTLFIVQRELIIRMLDAKTFYGESIGETEDGIVYSVGEVYPAGNGNYKSVDFVNQDGVTEPQKGLLSGDVLKVEGIRFWKENDGAYVTPKNAGSYYIKPYNLVITCADGALESMTDGDDLEYGSNYICEIYTPGIFTVMPRPIEVTLNGIGTDYFDGVTREYSAGGEAVVLGRAEPEYGSLLKKPDALVYGERLNVRVKFDKEPLFKGTYAYSFDNEASFIEVDGARREGGLNNYNILCPDGSLEITKRPVTVKMRDLILVYGQEVEYNLPVDQYYTVVGGLGFINGKITEMSVDYGVGSKPDTGSYTITADPTRVSYGTTSHNALDSYDITVLSGTLTITEKEVKIYVSQKTAKYGADYQGFSAYSISDLAYGETLTLSLSYFVDGAKVTPKNVRLYDVKITPILSVGEDGLKNYDISYWRLDVSPKEEIENALFVGGLEIVKLPVKVKINSQTVTYGDPLKTVEATPTPALPYDEVLSGNYRFEKNGKEISSPKYADTYDIVMSEMFIDGSQDGLNNYDFTCENGALTISRRSVTVALDPLIVKYGDPVQYESGNDGTDYTVMSGSFVYNDNLLVTPVFELKDTSETRPDAGTYAIAHGDYKVLFGEQEKDGDYTVAESYNISFRDAELTVSRRSIRFTLKQVFDGPFYYDGKGHGYTTGGETIEGDGMAEEEELQVAVGFYTKEGSYVGTEIGKAGEYYYTLDRLKCTVKNGGAKGIDNYDFSATGQVSCVILQREIKLTLLKLVDRAYGGNVVYPDTVNNFESIAPSDGLAEGESMKVFISFRNTKTGAVSDNGSRLSAGDYSVIPYENGDQYTVTGGIYADNDNYAVTFGNNSSFKVNKRHIEVTLSDITADYGETPVYPNVAGNYKGKIGGDGLADGEELTVLNTEIDMPVHAAVGEYKKAVKADQVRIEIDGLETSENYTVDYVSGNLTVVHREILITTNTTPFVYDGVTHSDGGYLITYVRNPKGKALAYDDQSKVSESDLRNLPSVTEYSDSKTENRFEVVIYNDGNAVAASNYKVTYSYGNIYIEKRIIHIATESQDKVYDGAPLVSSDQVKDSYHYFNNKDGAEKVAALVSGHSFVYQTVSITDAGYEWNDNVTDIVDGNGVSKAFNYEIKKTIGMLIVNKRNIYVDASSDVKPYDGTPLVSPDNEYSVYFYPKNDLGNTPLTGEENVLVSGHVFQKTNPSRTDAGTTNNNPYVGVTYDGADMTKNYNIVSRTGRLTVEKRIVLYSVEDLTMIYCNAAPDEAPAYRVQYEGEEADMGILNAERNNFRYQFVYSNLDGSSISRYNAGEYKIDLKAYDQKTGKNNYTFQAEKTGVLTIEKAKLTLRPASKREIYDSADSKITITADDLIQTGLADGDVITNPAFSRTELKASENKLSVVITISKSKLAIRDARTEESVLDNYEIETRTGTLSFIARTLYVEQIVPDGIEKTAEGRGQLPYTGEKRNFEPVEGKPFYRILEESEIDTEEKRSGWVGTGSYRAGAYGLLETDREAFKSASVGKLPMVYKQWVQLTLTSSSTKKSVGNLYNIVYVHRTGTDNAIEVLHLEVEVGFSSKLTQSYIDFLETTGKTVLLDASFIESYTGVQDGCLLEAGVFKKEDGTALIYVFIYQPRYGDNGAITKRTDKGTLYSVTATFASGIEQTVRVGSTATQQYPKE